MISAFVVSFLALTEASKFFEEQYKVKIDTIPDLSSSLQAIIIGTVIPLLSSVLPIKTALDRNLTEALDVQRSKTLAIYVNILQKNKKDITGFLMFGILALSYGFGVYYLLPLSLVSFNFSLMMSIFLSIIFGMIVSLGIISVNLLPMLNVFVSRIVLIFESSSLGMMTRKNLIAH